LKNYKNISIKQIMLLVEMIKPLFEDSREKKKKRGRPRKYSDEFILVLFFIRILRGYSFRTLRVEAGDLFSKDVPAISTIHYRIGKLDPDKLKKAVSLLARFIDNKLGNAEKEYVFADGTGFGFDDKIPLSYCRGKEIREVSGHVKTEILAASSPAGDYVYGIGIAPSYGDERKLLIQILQETPVRGKYFLADALYSMSIKLLKMILEMGFVPVIRTSKSTHTNIRNPLRKKVAELYEKYKHVYTQRYRIEQLIAKIKNSYGDRENARSYEMAARYVIGKVILFNFCFFISLLFLLFFYLRKDTRPLYARLNCA